MITATTYQIEAKKTAIFPANKALEYLSLGLVGEAGEVANKVKKIIRDKKIDVDVAGEIGDVLWYWVQGCMALNVDPEEVMKMNIEKLKSLGFKPQYNLEESLKIICK